MCNYKHNLFVLFCIVVILPLISVSGYAANLIVNQASLVDNSEVCATGKQNFSTFIAYRYSASGSLVKTVGNAQTEADASRAGLKIISLRRTAADMMLDLRFKISNAENAKSIMNRKTPVYLIDQVSGYRYRVPVTTKLGPLRQTSKRIDENRVYFIMFANPGRSIKKCDIVTVMVGNTSIDNIVVE